MCKVFPLKRAVWHSEEHFSPDVKISQNVCVYVELHKVEQIIGRAYMGRKRQKKGKQIFYI